MIADKMVGLVNNNSVIREMFEEGKRLAKIYGADKVYDFSLGNPSVPTPDSVKENLIKILQEENSLYVHGYMSNAGFDDVREAIAQSLNKRFGTKFTANNLIMTVGAAGGMNITFKALVNPGDEVIAFAPYFVEYRSYAANYDGKLIEISPNTVDFQPNIEEFEAKITDKTKIVIINSPNNPTGVVYSEATIKKIAAVLEKKQKEFGHDIFIFSDEPYRELAYDGVEVPYLTKYYNNTIVGYSYSKSLSLPGERIGYIVIPDEVNDYAHIYQAATIANRVLGFVNAPSLIQRAVALSLDSEVDLEIYNRNRELLYGSLTEYGYECIKPEGAFYLFVKSPLEDEKEFVNEAKKHNILVVPGSSFACKGYVRIAYCVSYDTIKNSLPGFKALAEQLIK